MDMTALKTALKRYGFDDSDPLETWINAAYHRFQTADRWPFLEQISASISVAAAATTVTLPSDFLRVHLVRVVDPEKSLEYMDTHDFDRLVDEQALAGVPDYFTLVKLSHMRLWPVPDTAIQVVLVYDRALPDFGGGALGDDEGPAIPTQFHYTLVFGAAAIGLMAENEESRATAADKQFRDDIDAARSVYFNRQNYGASTVKDVMDYGVR